MAASRRLQVPLSLMSEYLLILLGNKKTLTLKEKDSLKIFSCRSPDWDANNVKDGVSSETNDSLDEINVL